MEENKEKFVVNLHGASRNYNYGDVLLMAIYKSWIEENGGEVIMDMANSYYGNYLNVEHSISIKEAIKKADIIVYGGGGYFGEPRTSSLRWRTKFILHHMMPGILARMKGKPYGFFGVGFGPLNNWVIRKIGMYVINGADVISVRDKESKEYLLSYGCKKDIKVNPDTALSIALPESKYHREKRVNSKRKIALHLPIDQGKDYSALRNGLIMLLEELKSRSDFDFIFLVDHGLGKKSKQYRFFEDLTKDIDVDWHIEQYYDPEQTLSFISNCDAVITTKLHVAITSYAIGVKPIGISKHPKTQRFFKQVNLSAFSFDIEALLQKTLAQEIISLIESPEIVTDDAIIHQAMGNKNLLRDFFKK